MSCAQLRTHAFFRHSYYALLRNQQTDMLTAQQQERREFVLKLLSSYALLATHACRLNLSPVELRLSLLQVLPAASFCLCCVCFKSALLQANAALGLHVLASFDLTCDMYEWLPAGAQQQTRAAVFPARAGRHKGSVGLND